MTTNTTFDSTIDLEERTLEQRIEEITVYVAELEGYLAPVDLPDRLSDFMTTLVKLTNRLGIVQAQSEPYDNEPEPRQAAAHAMKLLRTVERLAKRAAETAAVSSPIIAIKLSAIQEFIDEESILFERFVWLGRVTSVDSSIV